MKTYQPLHLHTDYSLLDGVGRIPQYIEKASSLNIKSMAITDHGNMCGAIQFYFSCKEAGINPLIGCEVYTHRNRDEYLADKNNIKKLTKLNHLILIAYNNKGFHNLIKLLSDANKNGFYYKPIVSFKELERRTEGLYCLSACIGGELPKAILKRDKDLIRKRVKYYKNLFGKRYFLELMFNELDDQEFINLRLLKLSKKYDVPYVITADTHYVDPEDVLLQDILLAIKTKKTIIDSWKFSCRKLSFKSVEDLWLDIKKYGPELNEKQFMRGLENTKRIEGDITLGDNELRMPSFLPTVKESNKFMFNKCVKELKKKGLKSKEKYVERFKSEYKVIAESGFSNYFLIIEDIVNFAKKQNIFVGGSRGSVAGSLICFLLGITSVDPLKHDLMFERFINAERKDVPDIDLDFEDKRRDEIIEYVKSRWGDDRVLQIVTFSTFGTKGAIRDVAKVMDRNPRLSNWIANTIQSDETIIEGLNRIIKEGDKKELVKFIGDNDDMFKYAHNIAENLRNYGKHPAGLLVTPKRADKYVPLLRVKKNILSGFREGIKTKDISFLKLMKIDVLGLKTCTIIKESIELIRKRSKVDLKDKIWRLTLDNEEVYNEIREGNTLGAFQFESKSAREILRRVKPENFSDICACNAINRPAPLRQKEHIRLAENKDDEDKIEYDHPAMKSIFGETYSTWCYQEQVMKLLMEFGFSLGQADDVRRTFIKKSVLRTGKIREEKLKKIRKLFYKKCRIRKVDDEVIDKLWDKLEAYAVYTFNKSHSVGYSLMFYQCMYLKTFYPIEYMCVMLRNASGDKFQEYYEEAKRMGIKIKKPNIDKSGVNFKIIDDKKLIYGLGNLKNIGKGAKEIVKNKPFDKFKQLLGIKSNNRRLTSKVFYSLIISGALSKFGEPVDLFKRYNKLMGKESLDVNLLNEPKAKLERKLIFNLMSESRYGKDYN